MAALCAVTAIVSVVVPFAAGLALLGTVPTGLLAYRYRLRVLLAATVAAGVIAFLIAGMGGFMGVVQSAYVGGLTGIIKRKGRGTPTVIVSSLIAGLAFGAVMVGSLMVLSRLRHLIYKVTAADVDGVATFLTGIHQERLAADLKRYFADAVHYWQWLMLGHFVIAIMIVSLIGWWALSRLLERMRGIPDVHKLDAPVCDVDGVPIGPVPVRLDNVRFRYPNAAQDALRELSLDIHAGEHIAITGANGSGKTTLMLVLAGRQPTSGTVNRPGAVGLGKLGGTAVVLQHPESQVLGTRVADDVVWGLPPGTKIDVDRLLGEVGLDDLAERETGSLSGGELQRLALAAALAREPAMLIADEVTTMVDQEGRDALLGCCPVSPNDTGPRWCTSRTTTTRPTPRTARSSSAIRRITPTWSRPRSRLCLWRRPMPRTTHPCSNSSASATTTASALRGPRPRCVMSTSWSNRATGC